VVVAAAAGGVGAVVLLAERRSWPPRGATLARVGAWAVATVMLLLVPVVAIGLAVDLHGPRGHGDGRRDRARLGPGDLLVLEGPCENAGAVEFYSGHRPVLLDAARSVSHRRHLRGRAETFWSAPASRRPGVGAAALPADHARARQSIVGLAAAAERRPPSLPQRPLALRAPCRRARAGPALTDADRADRPLQLSGVFLVLLATGLGLPIRRSCRSSSRR